MRVEPYIFFDGRCEEALNFYKSCDRRGDHRADALQREPGGLPPGQPQPPADKVMHASFKVGDSDGDGVRRLLHGKPVFNGFSLTIPVKTEADAERRSPRSPPAARSRSPSSRRSSRPSSACSPTSSAWLDGAGLRNDDEAARPARARRHGATARSSDVAGSSPSRMAIRPAPPARSSPCNCGAQRDARARFTEESMRYMMMIKGNAEYEAGLPPPPKADGRDARRSPRR